MSWFLSIQMQAPSEGTTDERRAFCQKVMECLEQLDVVDADFVGELIDGPTEISFILREQNMMDAIKHGITAVRTAIHEAGGDTAGWPHCDDLDDPKLDGSGKWVIPFAGSSQKPALLNA